MNGDDYKDVYDSLDSIVLELQEEIVVGEAASKPVVALFLPTPSSLMPLYSCSGDFRFMWSYYCLSGVCYMRKFTMPAEEAKSVEAVRIKALAEGREFYTALFEEKKKNGRLELGCVEI